MSFNPKFLNWIPCCHCGCDNSWFGVERSPADCGMFHRISALYIPNPPHVTTANVSGEANRSMLRIADRGYRGVVNRLYTHPCVRAKLLQSCLTLCNPKDYSPPGSSVHGLSRQEYWSGLPCPPPGDLPDPGIEPRAPALQVDTLPLSHQGSPNTYVKQCKFHVLMKQ